MHKKFLKLNFHLRFGFNPYIRYKSNNMGNALCISPVKRDIPIIISMTSYYERFNDLELALYSIMNQTLLPDKIILYLSDEYESLNFLPYSITKYIKNGLEIKFIKDIGSYSKIIYALKETPNAIIVTADDDIIYPKDWLEKLYHSYISHPEDIHVHRAHRADLNFPYSKWEKHINEEGARYDNFLTGVGGVLYPPCCFIKEVFREDIFLKYSPYADDIWLWLMAVLSERKIRIVRNHIRTLTCTDLLGQIGIKRKKTLYSINKKGLNDKQLASLLKFYGNNVLNKIQK